MQVLDTLKNAWKLPDLRKKILFTLMILVVFRIGSVLPVPYIDLDALRASMENTASDGTLFEYLSILTGGALTYGAVFAMSVTPYINSSIIMQLLSVAIPALGRLSQEGEEGRKKMAKYTRYATVVLGLIQAIAYYFYLRNNDCLKDYSVNGGAGVFAAFVIILTLTAGSAIMMWLGERIDEKGIGNGISMILFAGIISRGPDAARALWSAFQLGLDGQTRYLITVPVIIIVFLLLIGFIVWVTGAERRIPVQYAKRVVGRKMYGGQNTYMPIQVNMSGVMPIIFASSILSIPSTITAFMSDTNSGWYKILSIFNYQTVMYAVLYFGLIIAFAYFYVTIQYDPVEMANNLRKNSGAVPGIRPGKPTSDYIKKILTRITLIGALFLGVIAILPIIVGSVGQISVSLGGTSILILVGVALDTVRSLESQMLMRHYKGFLD